MPESPAKFFLEPFDKRRHNRTAFSCEHETLVTYLREQASQDIKRRLAAVFVLTRDGETIAGYFTLSQFAVDAGEVPAALLEQLGSPRYPHLPATLIGRLARNLEFKGKGMGELLLMGALEKAASLSTTIASCAVVVDAKDNLARQFYRRFGFTELPDHPNRLFIPMKTVQ